MATLLWRTKYMDITSWMIDCVPSPCGDNIVCDIICQRRHSNDKIAESPRSIFCYQNELSEPFNAHTPIFLQYMAPLFTMKTLAHGTRYEDNFLTTLMQHATKKAILQILHINGMQIYFVHSNIHNQTRILVVLSFSSTCIIHTFIFQISDTKFWVKGAIYWIVLQFGI